MFSMLLGYYIPTRDCERTFASLIDLTDKKYPLPEATVAIGTGQFRSLLSPIPSMRAWAR